MAMPGQRYAHVAANAMWGDIDWARARLKPFAGKTVHVMAWPFPGVTLRVTPEGTWETAMLDSPSLADVRLRFSPAVLPRLASAPDKPGSAVEGDGDPVFLQALRDLGDVLPLAFEERLSSWIGPIAAHGIATAMRAMTAWPAAAAGRINSGVASYFSEESQTLLKKRAFADFRRDVAEVSARVDRAATAADAEQRRRTRRS
jgi:ubiquinone biosynthesis protein UbiJ